MKNFSLKLIFAFVALFVFAQTSSSNCVTCHEKQPPEGDALFIDRAIIESSVHADLDCVDCHVVDPEKCHEGCHVLCPRELTIRIPQISSVL